MTDSYVVEMDLPPQNPTWVSEVGLVLSGFMVALAGGTLLIPIVLFVISTWVNKGRRLTHRIWFIFGSVLVGGYGLSKLVQIPRPWTDEVFTAFVTQCVVPAVGMLVVYIVVRIIYISIKHLRSGHKTKVNE